MRKFTLYMILLLLFHSCNKIEPQVYPCGAGCESVEELDKVTARVVEYRFECNYVLVPDSLAAFGIDAVTIDSTNILVPCNEIPIDLMVNNKIVTLSGYKYDCCGKFITKDYGFIEGSGCKFEITSIEEAPTQLPDRPKPLCNDGCELIEEFYQKRAKIFLWGNSCQFVLETDSTQLAEGSHLDLNNNSFGSDILVPCNEIPSEFLIDQKTVIVSGRKYNCCFEIEHPTVKPRFGCRFEITAIEAIN